MPEKMQMMVTRARVMRQRRAETAVPEPTEPAILENNIKVLTQLTQVIENNPKLKFIEIIGRHIAKGLPLDEWNLDETY